MVDALRGGTPAPASEPSEEFRGPMVSLKGEEMLKDKVRGVARVACTAGLAAGIVLGGMPVVPMVAWAEGTGTLTITKNSSNADVSYEAYQLFGGDVKDADGGKTISGITWASGAEAVFKQVAGSGYTGSTAQDAADYIASNITGTNATTAVASDSFAMRLASALAKSDLTPTVVSPGTAASLASGYYFVMTKPESLKGKGAAGTSPIFTLVGGSAVSVNEKVTPPSLDKLVREDSTNAWGHAADANKGQAVSYRLVATLPSNLNSYEKYQLKFVDHLSSGLGYDAGSAKVYVERGGSEENREEVTKSFTVTCPDSSDTTVTAGQTALTASCGDVRALNLTGGALSPSDRIVVEYTAHLTDTASMGSTGNANQAWLVYSNDPHSQGTGETQTVTPQLYTYQINLVKQDRDSGSSKTLQGAKFTFQLADGGADAASKGKYLQEDGSLGDKACEFVTKDDGSISVPRIDQGTYTIRETKAPDGYQKIDDATLLVSSTLPAAQGEKLNLEASSQSAGVSIDAPNASTGIIKVTVKDAKNVGMPQTGSTGFVALMAGGGGLVAISLAGLLAHAKRSKSGR